jgi:hypothetical protein
VRGAFRYPAPEIDAETEPTSRALRVASAFQQAKSQPRNGPGEIFASTVAGIPRRFVSTENRIVQGAKKTPANRDKTKPLKVSITMLYQVLSRWLGRQDSNLGMAESKSNKFPNPINVGSGKSGKSASLQISRLV